MTGSGLLLQLVLGDFAWSEATFNFAMTDDLALRRKQYTLNSNK
jgi:hypothetical protein